jgi:hypothetical protein
MHRDFSPHGAVVIPQQFKRLATLKVFPVYPSAEILFLVWTCLVHWDHVELVSERLELRAVGFGLCPSGSELQTDGGRKLSWVNSRQ